MKKRKIIPVTMATPTSSHVKDKNSIFTARDEDKFFSVKGRNRVFHQYLYSIFTLIHAHEVYDLLLKIA